MQRIHFAQSQSVEGSVTVLFSMREDAFKKNLHVESVEMSLPFRRITGGTNR